MSEQSPNPKADLGVLVIHGMGTQKRNYASKMIAELTSRLSQNEQTRVAWESVYWANVLSNRQAQYLNDAKRGKLDFVWARRFVVNALSDAVAYRYVPSSSNPSGTTYDKIHGRVRTALKRLNKSLNEEAGLVVLAHSLGGHIISNYIWDAQKKNSQSDSAPFEDAGTLRRFITFGCNIPLFTFALDPVVPITLPSGAKWLNYYDRDDILGYPLQPINDKYKRVCKDIEINVGGFFTSWNFASHNKYWTDNDFTKPVAEEIEGLLQPATGSP